MTNAEELFLNQTLSYLNLGWLSSFAAEAAL